ncbi:MAG: IS1634 family transposase [Pseudomonadota bacterium]|nr:IS1634 family transposase [Pseudomonadota bacterium]
MYIRRTKTRQTASGESYYSHRLVRSERIGTKVRQRTLLNLGRHFTIEQTHWPAFCAYLEELLSGQETLLPPQLPADAAQEAQRIVARLIAREAPPSFTASDSPGRDYQSIDVDSMAWVRPRSVGVEQLGLWAMEQIGMIHLLEQLGWTGAQRAAAIGLIIGRMAAPGSELATYRWLSETSALGELLSVDYELMNLMQLYRGSDRIMKHRDRIEGHLFNQVAELFGLSCTVTLYDLTNTYFEGEAATNPKAKRSRSKEKRSDCPLLTLGLILDGSGFVRRSEVFSGNVSEGATLQWMLQGLAAPSGALVVMDRGIATEANLTWLRGNGYRYLVVSRGRDRHFDSQRAMTIRTASNETIQLYRQRSEDGKEVRLYCLSEQRARKEEGITRRFTERFERALNEMSDGLCRPRTTKQIDKLWERIGRLKEKSHGIAQHYRIEVIPDESGKKAKQIRWQRKPVEGSRLTDPGVYCLRSNVTDWDEERMWRTYMMLTDLEAVFRSLKSELGLRPIYHHKEERSDGHLFITVLAYQLVQFIRHRLQDSGGHDSWKSVRQIMNNQHRITATFRRKDGRTLHIRKATRAEPGQKAIYNRLGIDPAPGGVSKMIV